MSWDTKRSDGPKYYYPSERRDGQVHKVYVGRGKEAEDQARRDQDTRSARIADQAAHRAARERVERAIAATRAFRAAVALVTEASLLAVGVRFHRGEYRRMRNVKEDSMTATIAKPKAGGRAGSPKAARKTPPKPLERPRPLPQTRSSPTSASPLPQPSKMPPVVAPSPTASPTPELPGPAVNVDQEMAFKIVVDRAKAGNEECRRGLKDILDKNPHIWQTAGDLGKLAETAWLAAVADGNVLTDESARRYVAGLKAELAGDDPTPLEQMLVAQVGVTWLAAQHGEIQAAHPTGSAVAFPAFRLKQAESGQKRHLAALKALALVRAVACKG